MTLRILELLVGTAEAGNYCPISSIPCGGLNLPIYLGRVTSGIGVALIGILTGMLIFYTLKLAVSGQDESQGTAVRNAYLHALFGAILVAGATFIVATVPERSTVIIPGGLATGILGPVTVFFFAGAASALVINIGYYATRLIIAQDESGGTNARQGIIRGIIGLSIVLMGGAIVGAFSAGSPLVLADEAIGIGRFLITIFGTLAVVAIVVAGLMLVISADEQLKDRARKIILATAVAIIVVMASGVILSVFF
jgi:hypothetical protein